MVTVYKLGKNVGKPEFSEHISKIYKCYKPAGYKIDVIKESACLAVNPLTVDQFAYLFNCMPVGQGSDVPD